MKEPKYKKCKKCDGVGVRDPKDWPMKNVPRFCVWCGGEGRIRVVSTQGK